MRSIAKPVEKDIVLNMSIEQTESVIDKPAATAQQHNSNVLFDHSHSLLDKAAKSVEDNRPRVIGRSLGSELTGVTAAQREKANVVAERRVD